MICNSFFGRGGAIFVDYFNAEYLGSQSTLFLNNYAEYYGGGIYFKTVASFSNDLLRGTYFSGNRALDHMNVSSAPVSISLINDGTTFQLQGEPIHVKISISDQLSQRVCRSNCVLRLFAVPLDDEVQEGMFEPFPSLIDFDDLVCSADDRTLLISFQFVFSKSLPAFPKLLKNYSLALFASVNSGNENILVSNQINFTIRLCPVGYVLESDINRFYRCLPCLAGSFLNFSADPPVCSKCLLGKYSFEKAFECVDCARGEFSAEQGQADTCSACPSGTYSESSAQSFCAQCDVGFYSDKSKSSFCTPCPGNRTTRLSSSNSISACICPEGYFGLLDSTLAIDLQIQCKRCSDNIRGISCPTNSSIPKVESGFWRSSWDASIAHECIPRESCLKTEFDEITTCNSGFYSVRCGKCTGLSFRSVNGCNPCLSPFWLKLILSLACIAIISAITIHFLRNSHDSSLATVRPIISAFQSLGVLSRLLSTSSNSNSTISNISRVLNAFVSV
jgi:predicted outer membrane repeat protein